MVYIDRVYYLLHQHSNNKLILHLYVVGNKDFYSRLEKKPSCGLCQSATGLTGTSKNRRRKYTYFVNALHCTVISLIFQSHALRSNCFHCFCLRQSNMELFFVWFYYIGDKNKESFWYTPFFHTHNGDGYHADDLQLKENHAVQCIMHDSWF